MTAVLPLPPVTITAGLPFPYMLRLEDPTADDPSLPLTGFQIGWSIAESITAEPAASGTGSIVTDDAGQHAFIDISAAVTAGLTDLSLPVVRGRVGPALLQLTLTAPVPENSLILQGQANIQMTLAPVDVATDSTTEGTGVVESGQTINGYFEKTTDGEYEARHKLTTSVSGPVTWPFPGGDFIAEPNIKASAVADYAVSVSLDADAAVGSVTVSAYATATGIRVAVPVYLQANGRWQAL